MHKLAELCVRRPVFATMLVLSLTVVGGFSFIGLGVDLLPNIDMPTVAVTVINPGASPEQIETEITKKIEGAVNTISGIDELRSSSVEGAVAGHAPVRAREERRRRGPGGPRQGQPGDSAICPRPRSRRSSRSSIPAPCRSCRSSSRSDLPLREVTEIADEQIKQRLESISGVGQVQIVGGARPRDPGAPRSGADARLRRHRRRTSRRRSASRTSSCREAGSSRARRS